MPNKHWCFFIKIRECGYTKSLCFLFLFAFSVRLVYLFEIKNSDAFWILLGDAAGYDLWAQEIARGKWLGDDVFYQSPFYPYLLGLIYATLGRDLFLVRLIQILMGSLSCLFLAAAGAPFFGRRTGLYGGMLLAVYPTAVFFDGSIQKTGIALFLMTLMLMLLGRISQKPKNRLWLFSGLVLGCLGLTRENSLLLAVFILFWLYVKFGNTFLKKRLIWSCCFVVGLFLVLLPVGIRNKFVGNDFVLTTSQSGANFYIGNNKTADGLYRELVWLRGDWQYESADAKRLAEKEEGRRLRPSEVSSFWLKKTLSDIHSAPVGWMRLMLKKWLLLWNATEIGDTESQYAYYQWSFLLRIMGNLFHFGVLCPLAVTGVWLTWDRRRQLWLLYLILLGYAASITLFYIFARYRAPMIPVLALFAAAGIIEGISLLRRKQITRILVYVGMVTISAIIVNRKGIPPSYFAATNYSNLASHMERSHPSKAREYYRQAVHLNPFFVKGYFRLGCFLMRQGDPGGAVGAFTGGLKINPENDLMHYHTGLAYIELHRPDSALFHFRQVFRINPGFDSVVFYKMAVAQAMMWNREAAIAQLEQAVKNGFINKTLVTSEKSIDGETKDLFLRIIEDNLQSPENIDNATSRQE